MAKRKSLNKRRSRYSSAILNSDTEIFGDEYPYWWKNLEDTSLTQLSTDSKILNQTSRHLDSNSQIETSQVTGEWWKILDVSSIPNSPKTNEDIVEKNSVNNVPMSESEEEPEIAKKRHPLRSKAKQSRDNIFLNVLDDSMTTTSEVTQKNNNVVTSESEQEPEIAKRKFPLRSKATESKHNISSNVLNDSIITESDVKKQNNNVATSDSEEGSKIAKEKNILHLRAKRSKGNIFSNVLNDSMTTRSEVIKKNSNTVTSASEEELEIAKSKHHLRSKARESKDNIFLNVLNDSVTTKSDIKNKSNNIITSESEEEQKIAKKRHPLRSEAKQSRDNIFLNVLDDSMTTTSEVTQKNNNVVTSESEQEPEIAKRKFPLRSKATESKHNISSNVLNDSIITESDVKKQNNNVATSDSEEGSKIAKEKNILHLRAKRSKGNIFSNVLNDSMTTRSEVIKKNSNIVTSASEEELEIAKSKHHLRSKARESKDNIFLNVLNDSVTSKSDIKNKSNNIITSESEEEQKIAKKRHPLRSEAKQSRDNIFLNVLDDSMTTTSEVTQKNNNVVTSESEEEPEIAKRKFPLRSKAIESKDNIFSNLLNDTVRSKSGTIHETNNVPILESEESKNAKEEPKIAKGKYLSRSKVTESKDNVFSNVSDDSTTTKLKVMQRTGEKSSKSNSASNSETVANVEQLNEIQGYSLNHSQKTDDILKLKSNISKNKNNELQMTTNYLVPAITETSVSSETESNRYTLNFEDDSIHFAMPKAQSTILEGSSSSVYSSTKESTNSDTYHKILKWKSKLLTNHNKNAKKNLFETVLEEQESTIKIRGNATADGIAEHSLKSSKVSEALHLSRLPPSPSQKAISSPSKKAIPSPSKKAIPSPSKKAIPSPSKKAIPSPSKKAISSPSKKAIPSPSKKAISSPSKKAIPSPSKKAIPSPSKKAISSPSRHSTVVKTCTNTHSDELKGQTSIRHFLMSDKTLTASQMFWDKEKVDGIKRELERVKEREIARMKMDRNKQEVQKKLPSQEENIKKIEKNTKSTLQKQRPIKQVHKAFLVNGRAYRAPRLPRPQHWITDRLYKYLWKCMEPRFKLETRVVSEKFIHHLSSVTTLIAKRKSYSNYKAELYALMKEMARLDIIHTRNDFYNFCHDFFPYELRVKTVPMLLPGNKRNIPYNADTLHKPLLVP